MRPQDLGIGRLFESVRDAVVVAEANTGRIVLWNPAATEIFEYSPSEALELRIEALVPERLKVQHRAGLDRYSDTGQGLYINSHALLEVPALRKTGEEIHIEMTLSPIDPIQATAAGRRFVLAIIRDVTERRRVERRLRESEERFRLLAENAEDIIFRYQLKPNPGFDYVSPSVTAVTGYTPEEHYADPKIGLKTVHPDDRHLIYDVVYAPESFSGPLTLRFRRKSGELIWVEQHNKPIYDAEGDLVAIEGVARDVTERKLAEKELQRRTEELAHINAELEQFAYSVSHDLRAPLRSVDGFSQILLEDYAPELDEEGEDYLRRVRAASQRMGELIDNLLNLSRLTRGSMRKEAVDLSALAKAFVDELRESRPERRVEFVVEEGLLVDGDRQLLRVALNHLLDNAWKFTAKQPRAKIEFGTVQHDGEPAYFVRDDGAGFDMAYADNLFGPFQRLHSVTEFEGAGIGLAAVQRVIHRHGGRVWAEGAVGDGATFYFTLPRTEPGEQVREQKQEDSAR